MDRVVWIPFPPPYSHEFMERTNTWVKECPEKNFRIIVYNPQRTALGAGPNPLLFNLINGSQIYCAGTACRAIRMSRPATMAGA